MHLSRLRKTLEHELAAWRLRQEGPGAIEAVRHLGNDPPVAVYQGRGQAHELLGNFDAALEDYTRALESCTSRSGSPCRVAEPAGAGFSLEWPRFRPNGGYFRRALDVAQEMHDQATIGHSLNRLGNWHMMIEQPLEARHLHEQARRTFDQLDDPHGLAETLDLLGTTTL